MSPAETIRTRRERRLAARAFSVGGPPGSFMCRGRRRARPAPPLRMRRALPALGPTLRRGGSARESSGVVQGQGRSDDDERVGDGGVMPLRPCPHRELIPGPDATLADLAEWTATLAAPCAACVEVAPLPVEPAADPLPPEVAAALRQEGRDGARAAQAALDAMGGGEGLLGAVAARLSEQPGTGPWWRRWWAGWRSGALLDAAAR